MHYNFGYKIAHLPQPGIFFGKKHQLKFHISFGPFYYAKLKYHVHVPLDPFNVQNFTKYLQWILSFNDAL